MRSFCNPTSGAACARLVAEGSASITVHQGGRLASRFDSQGSAPHWKRSRSRGTAGEGGSASVPWSLVIVPVRQSAGGETVTHSVEASINLRKLGRQQKKQLDSAKHPTLTPWHSHPLLCRRAENIIVAGVE